MMPSLTQEQREAEEAVRTELRPEVAKLPYYDDEGKMEVIFQAAVRREQKLRAYQRAVKEELERVIRICDNVERTHEEVSERVGVVKILVQKRIEELEAQ